MPSSALLLLLAIAALPAAETVAPLPDPVCCTQGFTRRLVYAHPSLDASAITVRVEPADLVELGSEPLDARRVAVRLRARRAGDGMLSILDRDGRVLERRRLQEVGIVSNATRSISSEDNRADGSVVFGGALIMNPFVPGLDVRFVCLGNGVTVPDGLRERWVASETMVPTPSTGSAHHRFRMVRPPGEKWVPYSYVLYQDGEQIGIF